MINFPLRQIMFTGQGQGPALAFIHESDVKK